MLGLGLTPLPPDFGEERVPILAPFPAVLSISLLVAGIILVLFFSWGGEGLLSAGLGPR